MPKAAVWQTRRPAKKFLEKKRKEKEEGEEREGDEDDEDADAEDGDGYGDGDGGDEGDGPAAGEGAPGAHRDEDLGVQLAGVEGERVVGDGVAVGEGEGGVSFGAPYAPPTTQEESPREVQRDGPHVRLPAT